MKRIAEFISLLFSILLTNVILSIEWITMNVLKQNSEFTNNTSNE